MTLPTARSRFRRRRLGWSAALLALAAVVVALVSAGDPAAPGRAAAPTPRPRLVPNTGAPSVVPAAAQRRCFGAASRDLLHPCVNPALRLAVVPRPDDAVLEPNASCTVIQKTAVMLPCSFGVPAAQARATIALLGDSHAGHWRATLEGVARVKRWHGISISRSSCPFSRAVARLPAPAGAQCLRWNHEVLAFLRAHREISIVFVSEHSGGKVFRPDGLSARATQVAGYRELWAALPAHVTRIFVIRDTPRDLGDTADCVTRAIRRHRPAGVACSVPRRRALRPDPAAIAATVRPSPRVHLIDLSRYMCSPRRCLPVVGGALVHKDVDHITQTFGATLAPYMLRAVDAVVPG